MPWEFDLPEDARSVGYRYLSECKEVKFLPVARWTFVSSVRSNQELAYPDEGMTIFLYPKALDPGDEILPQLEFALKHEGVNLHLIK